MMMMKRAPFAASCHPLGCCCCGCFRFLSESLPVDRLLHLRLSPCSPARWIVTLLHRSLCSECTAERDEEQKKALGHFSVSSSSPSTQLPAPKSLLLASCVFCALLICSCSLYELLLLYPQKSTLIIIMSLCLRGQRVSIVWGVSKKQKLSCPSPPPAFLFIFLTHFVAQTF